ncbi:uncharacterized protein L203_103385 [Cryptococcus depauperatus CBS 7841]|uniref:Uncharacterized protein n=1 Tax=Cryptococcus depauperatus CBS 7841 TaxID=1295531 RepID=A0AAJ8JTK8_9TREE
MGWNPQQQKDASNSHQSTTESERRSVCGTWWKNLRESLSSSGGTVKSENEEWLAGAKLFSEDQSPSPSPSPSPGKSLSDFSEQGFVVVCEVGDPSDPQQGNSQEPESSVNTSDGSQNAAQFQGASMTTMTKRTKGTMDIQQAPASRADQRPIQGNP